MIRSAPIFEKGYFQMHASEKAKGIRRLCLYALYAVLMAFSILLVFWKCRYGLANRDEAFYLTIPYRLYQGDALFAHEWHLSQMSGVFLLPFVALYHTVTGSLDGIVLASRYLFTVCNLLASLFVFHRLKRVHLLGAVVASVCLLLFAPYGIMALSYNSIGILSLILCCVLLLTRTKQIETVLAGIFFAFAVLCNPYLIIVYLLAVLLSAFLFLPIRLLQVDRMTPMRKSFFKALLPFTLGAAVIAVLFTAFVLSRASISELLAALPHMMDDPEHPRISILDKILSFVLCVININSNTKYAYLGLGLLAGLYVFDKNRKQISHRIFYFVGVSACTLSLLLFIFLQNHSINHLIWPLCCFAPFVLLLSDNADNRQLFLYLWIPGMLYAFCMHLSSNTAFYSISAASIVALMGTIPMITSLVDELSTVCSRRILKSGLYFVLSVLCLTLLGMEARDRYVHIFGDSSIETQTEYVETGLDRGIYTSTALQARYDRFCETVDSLKTAAPTAERVLFVDYNTAFYLMSDLRMGAYSAWLSTISASTVSRLDHFYKLQPHLMPDAIFIDPKYTDCGEHMQDTFGYQQVPFDLGILLVRN